MKSPWITVRLGQLIAELLQVEGVGPEANNAANNPAARASLLAKNLKALRSVRAPGLALTSIAGSQLPQGSAFQGPFDGGR
jgi:hypothetical protein